MVFLVWSFSLSLFLFLFVSLVSQVLHMAMVSGPTGFVHVEHFLVPFRSLFYLMLLPSSDHLHASCAIHASYTQFHT